MFRSVTLKHGNILKSVGALKIRMPYSLMEKQVTLGSKYTVQCIDDAL